MASSEQLLCIEQDAAGCSRIASTEQLLGSTAPSWSPALRPGQHRASHWPAAAAAGCQQQQICSVQSRMYRLASSRMASDLATRLVFCEIAKLVQLTA